MNLSLVTWIIRSYMLDIPPEIEDAARTDGASDLRILVSIIIPMCLPGIITAAVIAVIFAINEFLFTLLIASTQNAYTLSVALANFTGGSDGVIYNAIAHGRLPRLCAGAAAGRRYSEASVARLDDGRGQRLKWRHEHGFENFRYLGFACRLRGRRRARRLAHRAVLRAHPLRRGRLGHAMHRIARRHPSGAAICRAPADLLLQPLGVAACRHRRPADDLVGQSLDRALRAGMAQTAVALHARHDE